MKQITLLTTLLIILICSGTPRHAERSGKPGNSLTDLDTILVADSLNFLQKGMNNVISIEQAETAVDEYFAAKESFRQGDLRMCAQVDTVIKLHLNNDRFIDAVVGYDVFPCVGNGHCYLVHTALLTYINGKYRMISQDIIPNSFIVESIYQDEKSTIIKGFDEDCPNEVTIRKFTARLARN
jgi:hypothetical protein